MVVQMSDPELARAGGEHPGAPRLRTEDMGYGAGALVLLVSGGRALFLKL
jgi:hypothetical protein